MLSNDTIENFSWIIIINIGIKKKEKELKTNNLKYFKNIKEIL